MCFITQQRTTKPASILTEDVLKADLFIGRIYRLRIQSDNRLLKYRKSTLCVAGPRQERCEVLPKKDGVHRSLNSPPVISIVFHFVRDDKCCRNAGPSPCRSKMLQQSSVGVTGPIHLHGHLNITALLRTLWVCHDAYLDPEYIHVIIVCVSNK